MKMDGETNGSQKATQGSENASQQQGQEQQETQQQGQSQVETPDYEKQLAERDEKIASLETHPTRPSNRPWLCRRRRRARGR